MKKFFQIILVYTLGMVCVFSFVWRATSLDKQNNKLAKNYEYSEHVYNN